MVRSRSERRGSAGRSRYANSNSHLTFFRAFVRDSPISEMKAREAVMFIGMLLLGYPASASMRGSNAHWIRGVMFHKQGNRRALPITLALVLAALFANVSNVEAYSFQEIYRF